MMHVHRGCITRSLGERKNKHETPTVAMFDNPELPDHFGVHTFDRFTSILDLWF